LSAFVLLQGTYRQLRKVISAKDIPLTFTTIFSDTEHERNALMENVYPKLREFCQKKGYEFQVVDMRWGVRDDATNTHMTTELCLREIKACQEISVGPNFVVTAPLMLTVFTLDSLIICMHGGC